MSESTWEGKVLFRTDLSGNEIAIRPNELLVEIDSTAIAKATGITPVEARQYRGAAVAMIRARDRDEPFREDEPFIDDLEKFVVGVKQFQDDNLSEALRNPDEVQLDDGMALDLAYKAAVRDVANAALEAAHYSMFDEDDEVPFSPLSVRSHVRGDWWAMSSSDLEREGLGSDVVLTATALRERGIAAQPNHVYFLSSRAERHGKSLAPNTLAPNTLAPNTLAPNTLAPNTLAGVLAQMGRLGAIRCCCPRGLSDEEDREVPRLAARPANAPLSAACASTPDNAAGVKIFVIDSKDTQELIKGGQGYDGDANLAADLNGDKFVDPAVGHGNFVQNIIKRESGLESKLLGYADCMGVIDDVQLVDALKEAERTPVKEGANRVLNMSLAGYTQDDRPTLAVASQIKTMIAKGWVIVAAAGNNADCRLTYPAALPGVVSVGSYGQHGGSWFSNYGPWVDACALGEDVLAQFPKLDGSDFKDLEVDKRSIWAKDFNTGWAIWSGTSFAAPFVTARLASAILAAKDAGKDAADAVRIALDEVLFDRGLVHSPLYGTVVT